MTEAFRVLYCHNCNMTFSRWEKIEDRKDEDNFVCEVCLKDTK